MMDDYGILDEKKFDENFTAEDIVYYTKDACFFFSKSTDYKYLLIQTEAYEEGDGIKTTIPFEILNECLRNSESHIK